MRERGANSMSCSWNRSTQSVRSRRRLSSSEAVRGAARKSKAAEILAAAFRREEDARAPAAQGSAEAAFAQAAAVIGGSIEIADAALVGVADDARGRPPIQRAVDIAQGGGAETNGGEAGAVAAEGAFRGWGGGGYFLLPITIVVITVIIPFLVYVYDTNHNQSPWLSLYQTPGQNTP